MPLPSNAHVSIGGVEYRLDEAVESMIGRRAGIHQGRSLFTGRTDITGRPGTQNLRAEELITMWTNFDGEGQKNLLAGEPLSARRFYRSEGLDFRTPGQFQLNHSTIAQSPLDSSGGAATTVQGAANFADITGTSATSGTDRELQEVGDKVASDDHAPGASRVQADFYLFKDPPEETSIEGSTFHKLRGDGATSGTDFRLRSRGSTCESGNLTGLTADVANKVDFYAFITTGGVVTCTFKIWNQTNGSLVVEGSRSFRGTTTGLRQSLSFVPKAGKNYRARVAVDVSLPEGTAGPYPVVVDKVTTALNDEPSTAIIEVFNTTGAVSVATRTINVAALSAGQLVGSIIYTAAAATNYDYRVEWEAGNQSLWVDKVTATVQSTSVWTLDAIELGQSGKVWLAGHRAGVDSQTWTYDPSTDAWDDEAALNDTTASTNETIRALCHSDAKEYVLTSGDHVYSLSSGGADAEYANATALTNAVGMAICQDRLFVLEEGSAGVFVKTFAVDGGAAPYSAALAEATVSTANVTADTTLRNRVCGTPTGARFFVNYSNRCVIYEADASGTSLVVRELETLGTGVRGKAIAYEGGVTFITAQFRSEADQTSQSAIWVIDKNGVLNRIGYFRFDDPSGHDPQSIQVWQDDVWFLQGRFVWRYSLKRGGLFQEYRLQPTTPSNQRGIAVLQGRTFALYTDEVWVTGTEGTYRQSGSEDGNTWTSSVDDFALPGFDKLANTITVLTDEMAEDDDSSLDVEYQLDQDGTWVAAGSASSGSKHVFRVATAENAVIFNTIQVRVRLSSGDGTTTPVVHAVVMKARPSEREEMFNFYLLCQDDNSSDHPAGSQTTGAQKARHLFDLWRSGAPTTLVNGYEIRDIGGDEYIVTIEDIEDQRNQAGEGRVYAQLRVLN